MTAVAFSSSEAEALVGAEAARRRAVAVDGVARPCVQLDGVVEGLALARAVLDAARARGLALSAAVHAGEDALTAAEVGRVAVQLAVEEAARGGLVATELVTRLAEGSRFAFGPARGAPARHDVGDARHDERLA